MKYECDVVRDLMPLYIDDVLSENSKIFVKDHIDSCEACRKYYEKLSSEVKIPVSRESRKKDLRPIEYLKANLSRKIIKRVLAVVLVVGFLVGGFAFATQYEMPVDPSKVDFYEKDDFLMMKYDGQGDLIYSAGASWENRKVWTIRFWQTPFEKYITPLYKDEKYKTDFMPLYNVKKVYDDDGNVLWEKKDK
ncbi:zf-HC2 domain-containing protein [uncultured Anaerococcus sp.]|uniref:zf-HC2 domain-containing protein n=1 Tax=uncultured Anaerococcus sp. TaxID=293428 RepID=UPI0028037F2A|nr:zf-HC2 domain-containing protein [uncultured Anaerococcus sp.]